MKIRTIKILSVTSLSLFICGCGMSSLSTRQTNPLLTDYQGILTPWTQAISTMSPDASRRITIMRLSDADYNYDTEKWRAGEFCAEPPPDAMVNTASQIYDAIAAKIKVSNPQTGGTNGEGSGQNQFMQQVASSMSPLLRRSQGLQWTRDNLSFVCNAHLNRVIDKTQYIDLVKDIISRSERIINAEMQTLPKLEYSITGAPSGAPTLLTPPTPVMPSP
jgi:hypothetical protein